MGAGARRRRPSRKQIVACPRTAAHHGLGPLLRRRRLVGQCRLGLPRRRRRRRGGRERAGRGGARGRAGAGVSHTRGRDLRAAPRARPEPAAAAAARRGRRRRLRRRDPSGPRRRAGRRRPPTRDRPRRPGTRAAPHRRRPPSASLRGRPDGASEATRDRTARRAAAYAMPRHMDGVSRHPRHHHRVTPFRTSRSLRGNVRLLRARGAR